MRVGYGYGAQYRVTSLGYRARLRAGYWDGFWGSGSGAGFSAGYGPGIQGSGYRTRDPGGRAQVMEPSTGIGTGCRIRGHAAYGGGPGYRALF